MKKRISVLLALCLLLLVVQPLTVMAAQSRNMIQTVEIAEENLSIRCAAMEGAAYALTLDGTALEVRQSTVEQEDIPVTFFCLVDTSGSIGDYKMEIIQDTLMTISAAMDAADSMVVAEFNDQMTLSAPLLTQQERQAAIEAISSSGKDTSLYAGIAASIDEICSNEAAYNPYVCLVVLSDGGEDQNNGLSVDEVSTAILQARIPVYTVAILGSEDVKDEETLESAKVMGSFARNSSGGLHLTTVEEGGSADLRPDASGEEFGSAIWRSMMSTAMLFANLEGVVPEESKTTVELLLECRVGDNVYTESCSFDRALLPMPTPTPTPEAIEAPTPEPTQAPEPTQTPTQEFPVPDPTVAWYVWVVIAVGVAGIVAAGILVGMAKKKKKQQAAMLAECLRADVPQTGAAPEVPSMQPVPETAQRREVFHQVLITDIPYGQQKLQLSMKEEQPVSFGRDQRASCTLNAADSKLSGKHFSLFIRSGIYSLRDEGSLNGTYLNGVQIPKNVWVKMENGDKVRAGSYEYRVMIDQL